MPFITSRYFYGWILATTFAAIVGSALNIILLVAFRPDQDAFVLTGLGLIVFALILIGALTGVCQWLVLREAFRKAYWWIAATALGEALAFAAQPLLLVLSAIVSYFELPFFLSRILTAVILSIASSLLPWAFLRSRVEDAWLWILFSIIADVLAINITTSSNFLSFLSETPIFQSITTAGLIGLLSGVVTGIPMDRFIRERTTSP